MPLMTWTENYSVGIKSIDAQHQKLIGMLNELQDAMLAGKANDHIGKILDGLVQYTVTHFAYEEKLFAQHGYKDAAAHKAEHDKLTKQVADFAAQFKTGKAKLSSQLMSFLRDWLNGHILGTDKRYTTHLVSKGVA